MAMTSNNNNVKKPDEAVFVSFNCAQRSLAVQLCSKLVPEGLFKHVYIDIDKTPDEMSHHIDHALSLVSYVIVFVSNEYRNSRTCEKEARCIVSHRLPTLIAKLHPSTGEYSIVDGFTFTSQVNLLVPPGQTALDDAAQALTQAVRKHLSSSITSSSKQEINDDRKKRSKEVKFVDIPNFSFDYFEIHDENEILLKINALTALKGGVLLLSGGGGVGKTTLVSHLLQTSSTFFQDVCFLEAILWLNCYKWREKHTFSDDESFIGAINQLFNKADMDAKDSNGSHRVLLILDDIYQPALLETVFKHWPKATCLAISRDADLPVPSDYSGHHVQLAHLNELNEPAIVELFENNFQLGSSRLNREKLEKLAKICCGLPLIVSVVAARFRNRLLKDDDSLSADEYVAMTKDSTRSIADILAFTLDREDAAFRQTFYAFLLFEPGEPVNIDDLAILWRCTSSHQAFVRCQQFVRKSLIRQLPTISKENHVDDAADDEPTCFTLHQLMHEAAVETAIERQSFASNLQELRYKIATGHCNQAAKYCGSSRKVDLLARAVEVNGWALIETIFNKLDASDLAELCRKNCPGTDGKSFLHFLYSKKAYHLLAKALRKFVENKLLLLAEILNEEDQQNGSGSLLQQIFDEEELLDGFFERRKLLEIVTSVIGCYDVYVRSKWLKQAIESGRDSKLFLAAVKGELDTARQILDDPSETSEVELYFKNQLGETPLIAASAMGHLKIVEELLLRNAGMIEAANENGWTAMAFAASYGHLDVVRLLYETNPQTIKAEEKNAGWIPFMLAIQHGHFAIADFLLEKDAEQLEFHDLDGLTPLMVASQCGYLDLVKFLLKKSGTDRDAFVRRQDLASGWTAFMHACRFGQLEVVKFLHDEINADLATDIDHQGRTPLSIACECNQLDVVKWLFPLMKRDQLDHVVAADIDGRTPLMMAAQNGHLQIVRFLVGELDQQVVAKSAVDRDGRSAIAHAIQHGHLEIVRFLFENCCRNSNSAGEIEQLPSNNTPLMIASEFGQLEIVKYLMSRQQADSGGLNAANSDGMTATMFAAQCGHLEIVRFLFGKLGKSALMSRDNLGSTPLMLAVGNNQIDVVRFCLEKHPEGLSWRGNESRSSLMIAAAFGHLEMAKLLLEHNADELNWQGDHGETALMLAAHCGEKEMAQFLCEQDPTSVDEVDGYGVTAVMVAAVSGNDDICKMLARYQKDQIAHPAYLTQQAFDEIMRDPLRLDSLSLRSSLAALRVLTFEDTQNCEKLVALGILPLLSNFLSFSRVLSLEVQDSENVTALLDDSEALINDLDRACLGSLANIAETEHLLRYFFSELGGRLFVELTFRLEQPLTSSVLAVSERQFLAANIAAFLLRRSDPSSLPEQENLAFFLSRFLVETWKSELDVEGELLPQRQSLSAYVTLLDQNLPLACQQLALWSLYQYAIADRRYREFYCALILQQDIDTNLHQKLKKCCGKTLETAADEMVNAIANKLLLEIFKDNNA